MTRTSSSEGPTWRGTNVSGAGSGVTARLLEMGAGARRKAGCARKYQPARGGATRRAWSKRRTRERRSPPWDRRSGARRAFARSSPSCWARSVLRRGVGLAFDLLLPVIHGEEQPHARPLLLLVLRRHRQAEPVLLRLERHAVV